MKKMVLTAAAVSLGLVSQAQVLPGGLYLKADAGGNITEDTSLREFFGAVTPGSKVKFDPGARVGFGVGYDLCQFFAVEGEIGVMANSLSSISEADRVDAVFSNVPFMVNAKLHGPRQWCVSPYIGGGAGVSAAILDVDRITLNDTRLHGSEADAVFAYQGFAGLRWHLNDAMGLSVEYRFFGTEAPEWRAHHAHDVDTNMLRFGDIRTHAFSVAFDWTF